jgi:hypothetical protein
LIAGKGVLRGRGGGRDDQMKSQCLMAYPGVTNMFLV